MLEIIAGIGSQLLTNEAVQKSIGTGAVALGTTAWTTARNAWTRRQDRLKLEQVRDQFNLLSKSEGARVRAVRDALELLAAFDAFATQIRQERTVAASTTVALCGSGSLFFLYPVIAERSGFPALSNEELAAAAMLIPFVSDPVARLWRTWRGQSQILDAIGAIVQGGETAADSKKSESSGEDLNYQEARANLQQRLLRELTILLQSSNLYAAFGAEEGSRPKKRQGQVGSLDNPPKNSKVVDVPKALDALNKELDDVKVPARPKKRYMTRIFEKLKFATGV